MPRALITVAGYFTGAGAGTGTAIALGGDTLVVPNFNSGQGYLEQIWGEGASTTVVDVKSARMHDANQGIRLQVAGLDRIPLLPGGTDQPLYSGDAPTYQITLGAAATGLVAAVQSFDDLSGANARLGSWADVQPRIKNISGVEVDLQAIAAIGSYSPGDPINKTFDNFKADTDYALLGYLTSGSVGVISVAGQDTGNQKVGGPGVTDAKVTRDWFVRLSNESGRPSIPIIAANNKGGTLVYQGDNSAHAAINVSLIMAELG